MFCKIISKFKLSPYFNIDVFKHFVQKVRKTKKFFYPVLQKQEMKSHLTAQGTLE